MSLFEKRKNYWGKGNSYFGLGLVWPESLKKRFDNVKKIKGKNMPKKTKKTEELEKPPRLVLRMGVKEMAIIGGSILLIVMIMAAGLFYFMGRSAQVAQEQSNATLSKQLVSIKQEQTQQKHMLVSRISYGDERQRIVLFLRDTIYNYWQQHKIFLVREKGIPKSQLSIEKAFKIASYDVSASEIYPEVDALLLASLQFQESRWGLHMKSDSGALGLNHFMPSTGVLITAAMGIPYSKEVLMDKKLSTEMAAKYLNMMYSLYGTWGEALADYNGGPWSALYYKTKSLKLSKQTALYVPEVLKRWEGYRDALIRYKPDISSINKEKQ